MKAAGAPGPLLEHLRASPQTLELLTRALGASPFLAEILIRHPSWLYWLSEPGVLSRNRTSAEIEADLRRALAPLHTEDRQRDTLRVAKRREILFVGVRDLLRYATVEETLTALSTLADVLVATAYDIAEDALRRENRVPPATDGAKTFAVVALGKLGASELNFSSDVDLLFVARDDHGRPEPDPPQPGAIDSASLARRLTAVLADLNPDGYVYRVDLRLRPEGRLGALVPTLGACESYYRTRGSTWERLALLRARPIAGDLALGQRFVESVTSFVFGRPFDDRALAEMRGVKQGLDRKIAAMAEEHRHVKLGIGGIREIEFVTQALQVSHGVGRPELRARRTLEALSALQRAGLLTAVEHDTLESAYLFLRDVENKLQMVLDAQTHSLPEDASELRACARRLGYDDAPGKGAGEALRRDYEKRTAAVHEIYRAIFESGRLLPA